MTRHRIILWSLIGATTLLVLPNLRSLYEGVFFYLRDVVAYSSSSPQALNPHGRYTSLHDLARLRNVERYRYISARLESLNVAITRIPIPDSPFSNLLVTFDSAAPLTIYAAHYDKLYDDPDYPGASDNTAAVSVLLAAIGEFARTGNAGNRAFLLTGEEERGLRGAAAFVGYARANNLAIREIITFDNIGRGQLAMRPLAESPGYVFWLPVIGDMTYDGAQFRATAPYPRANARLTQTLAHALPNLVVYERFTARGDANVFQQNGIDTVMISGDNMYYLQRTWHNYADRIELLDERNLDLAYELIRH